jgi:hypothetical protein
LVESLDMSILEANPTGRKINSSSNLSIAEGTFVGWISGN